VRIEGFNKSVTYQYRADGTKLKKSFIFTIDDGALYFSSTEYLDGFHYVSSTWVVVGILWEIRQCLWAWGICEYGERYGFGECTEVSNRKKNYRSIDSLS